MLHAVRHQTESLLTLDDLVPKNHPFRAYERVIDIDALAKPLDALYSDRGRRETGAGRGLRLLILQFMHDLSDREMERFISDNNAARWFCGFGVQERTPDHSWFCKFRSRLGTKGLMDIFAVMRESMKCAGLVREATTFVDSSKLESKLNAWKERDRVIAAGCETFNNQSPRKLTMDLHADFGSKGFGPDKNWYGLKDHSAVDMDSGLITRVAVTRASVPDAKGLERVCPRGGEVYADKAYCGQDALGTIRARGCEEKVIKRSNMKDKDWKRDAGIAKKRMPLERVFSKRPSRLRYIGIEKAQFQVAAFAMAHNFKRLVALNVERVPIV